LKIYDIAVVGSGVAGAMVAYFAKQRGLKCAILDRSFAPAMGGSAAAGAFISPKLGKETPLLKLTNLAYSFAINFYTKNFKDYFNQSGILRLPKDSKDAKEFKLYQESIKIPSILLKEEELESLGIKNQKVGLLFKSGGVCDAQGLCKALIKDIDYYQVEVKDLDNLPIKAKNIILATGYEGFRDYLDYMGISGVWGSRGDFFSTSKLDISMHKSISISGIKDGVVKIGATHTRAKNPTNACMQCSGEPLKELIKEAHKLIDLKDLKLKETFCGMRAGSRDYTPVVGKVIDTKYMLDKYPNLKKGYNKAPLKYIPNLYVLNGLGGRGFVLAPLMAKWLLEIIYEDKEYKVVDPNRLFLKWVRKLK